MVIIVIQLIILALLLYIIYVLLYSMIKGGPYAPVSKSRIHAMFKLLDCKKGESLADLGSGDGRILLAAKSRGLKAFGYEINPVLYILSKIKLKNKATVYLKSYWNADMSNYKYITIYGVTYIMPGLEKKLLKELLPGSKVVTNHFRFPNWKHSETLNDVYLYIK